MKKLLITLIAFAFTLAARAADASLTGTWQVDSEVVGNTSSAVLDFTQDGNKLTVLMKAPDGKEMKVTGKFEGKKVTWSFTSEYEGNPLTVSYVGTLDDKGVITGTNEVQPMGIEGTFVAKRVEKGAAKTEEKK